MTKTIKFTISLPAAEFKHVESLRRRSGRTRSRLIRDAVAALSPKAGQPRSVKEEHSAYGILPLDSPQVTDPTERRRRAIAAAGRFHSGAKDLSTEHDRYLDEAFAGASPVKDEG